MPNENGKIFINGNTTPPKGVDVINDIAYVLGESSGDIGYLITQGNINPWALYKPYRANELKSNPRTLNLSVLGFGTPPNSGKVQTFIEFYENNGSAMIGGVRANGWQYLRPRANQTPKERFRVFDFLKVEVGGVPIPNVYGYDANADNPYGTFRPPVPVAVSGGNLSCSQSRIYPETGWPDYDICASDFNGLDVATGSYRGGFLPSTSRMLFYGMLLVPLDNNDKWTSGNAILVGNDTPIDYDGNRQDYDYKIGYRGTEQFNVGVRLSTGGAFSAIKYKVYPFITNLNFSESPISAANKYITRTYAQRTDDLPNGIVLYPIPGAEPATVKLYDDSIEVIVYAEGMATKIGDTYDIDMYYTIENKTANSITIPESNDLYTLTMRIRKPGNTFESPRQQDEVFYSKDYRWDDNSGTAGTYDSTYATFLNTPLTIARGEIVRVPLGTLTTRVAFKLRDCVIHIGFYLGTTWHHGHVVPSTPNPHDPT